MTWSRAHRRNELINAVLDDISGTGRPVIPARWLAEVDAEFGGFEEFLRAVQLRWYRTFDAHLDALLEAWPADIHAALVQLWQDVAGTMPTVRFLLDAHIDHKALADLHRRHRRTLYAATGVYLDHALAAQPHTTPPSRPRDRRMLHVCRWLSAPGTSAT